MAKFGFILQAVSAGATHADAVRKILTLHGAKRVLVSVGFAQEAGVAALEAAIKPVAKHTRFYIGVRNGLTSVQAVRRLLGLGVEVFGVDTGSRHVIFHPKLYLVASQAKARIVIGSANLTFNGLHNNIEASASIELDLSDQDQKAFFESTNTAFTTMVADYPKHVFAITSASQADELCESGRLADETIVPALPAPSVLMTGNRDDLPRMGLHLTPPPRKKAKPTTTKAPTATKPSAAVGKAAPRPSGYYLVWESKPLSARDLSIPRAKSTNPTGSMGLKKGTFDNIDQRHYFRDDVFVDLNWKIEPAGSIWERARARFDLVVKDLNYGPFNLQLSHNTDTTSATYKQNNFMTQLHWGKALVHVAKDDLLGRTLRLYREDNAPPRFLIEID